MWIIGRATKALRKIAALAFAGGLYFIFSSRSSELKVLTMIRSHTIGPASERNKLPSTSSLMLLSLGQGAIISNELMDGISSSNKTRAMMHDPTDDRTSKGISTRGVMNG